MKQAFETPSDVLDRGPAADLPSERKTPGSNGFETHLNETRIQIYGPYLHPRSVQLGVTERTALPMNTQTL